MLQFVRLIAVGVSLSISFEGLFKLIDLVGPIDHCKISGRLVDHWSSLAL